MPAPVRPHSEGSGSGARSALSGADETESVGAASSDGPPAGLSFGKPAASGEVGTLGPYRLVKELGRGGMGAVYAAVDTRLDRRLALKLMLPKFATNASAKERFLREARAAAKINHDNVVTVYEADERGGMPYIAMQFLEGYPLDEYLKNKGNPSIPQVLRVAAETAAGLAAAHKTGLVHRDIKPANLWLEAPNGRVKVLDFGLAKPVDTEVELTKSGMVVGTPAYMSPEQARGEKVDARTDLFSLGGVLYRLCTGRLPFHGPTTMAVLLALATEEPPPVRELNPEVPESLAALVHQLLAKHADARPNSAAGVVKQLRAIAEELKVPRTLPVEQSTSQPHVIPSQVVYVPIAVTALPEQNPFADLDVSASEVASRDSATVLAPAPESERKKPAGRFPWALAGALAFAALVVGGVIIIRNKDGTETKIEVPDGATVAVKDKGGKTLAKIDPGKNPPPIDTSADRKAAEWAIKEGGTVRVNGQGTDIKAAADLPKERFALTSVSLPKTVTEADLTHLTELKSLTHLRLAGKAVTDAGLAHLRGLQSLTFLNLDGRAVTDAGLAHLTELKNLMTLGVAGKGVTDAGLAHLTELKSLTSLNLITTGGLTDAGLAYLKELKNLTGLNVRLTKVSAKGLADFHAAVPACRIEHDGGIIQAIDVDRTTAEWVISEGGSVSANGQRIYIRAVADLPKDRITLTNLSLNNTKVTDAGLAHLKDCKGLTTLLLSSTPVTDAGLAHLKDCKGLTNLDVRKTKVTAKGLEEFHAAVPGCNIYHDGGVIQPKK